MRHQTRGASRSKSVTADSIESLSPDLVDYAYVCSTATGRPGPTANKIRRYVGFGNSRVSDSKPGDLSFGQYRDWISSLSKALQDAAISPSKTFQRYAKPLPVPPNPAPEHLLLDLLPEDFEASVGSMTTPLRIDLSYEVNEGLLQIRINGDDHQAQLAWNGALGKYMLKAPTVVELGYRERSGDRRELVESINRNQTMRIVTDACKTVYAHGDFFAPVVPHRSRSQFRLLDVLVKVPELGDVSSEKGGRTGVDDWDPKSVFGLISALSPSASRSAPIAMSDSFPKLDFLLCTDMGTEVADFIVSQPGRIAMIHAKGKIPRNRSKLSASSLQEVLGQAVKNLLYLQPLSSETPPSAIWKKKWKLDVNDEWGVVRLRHGSERTETEMWDHAREQITSPSADREVWIVLGNALSKSALVSAVDSNNPSAETIQIYALLQNAWSATSQVGARLRVFCSP